jgi:hypothetical protein
MYIDREGAWHYLHYLWIASLFASILFSMIGLLLLVLVPQDLDLVSIASLSFMSAIVIVGLAFEACKRKAAYPPCTSLHCICSCYWSSSISLD